MSEQTTKTVVIDINESRKRAEAAIERTNTKTAHEWTQSARYPSDCIPLLRIAQDLLLALEEIERLNEAIDERNQGAFERGERN